MFNKGIFKFTNLTISQIASLDKQLLLLCLMHFFILKLYPPLRNSAKIHARGGGGL